MIPNCTNGQWGYEVIHFAPEDVTEMCFPDENYAFEAGSLLMERAQKIALELGYKGLYTIGQEGKSDIIFYCEG